MKKTIALALAIIMLALSLVSCGYTYTANEWFDGEYLEQCLVRDFPMLDKDFLKFGQDEIYVRLSGDEYAEYLSEVYAYLSSCDLAYLGTRGDEHGSFKGMFTSYLYEEADELEDFYVDGSYYFVYSDGSTVSEDGYTVFCIVKISGRDSRSSTVRYDGGSFKYNTVIRISYYSEHELSGRYYLIEELHAKHSTFYNYDEMHHWLDAACDCGVDNERDPHCDGDGDMLCDVCQYPME